MTIPEERLDELDVHLNLQEQIAGPDHSAMVPIATVKMLISAARRLNAAEAERDAEKERNRDLWQSLRNIKWTLGVDDIDDRSAVFFVERLKAERDALQSEMEDYKATVDKVNFERVQELSAHVERLRKAVNGLLQCPDVADSDYKDEETHRAEREARQALAATPAQSLAAVRREERERCAKVAENGGKYDTPRTASEVGICKRIATDIRNLENGDE